MIVRYSGKRTTVDCYAFVVDTEEYTGGIERPMVAYMTSQLGDCQVGEEEAETAARELASDRPALRWFDRNVIQRPDDNGCNRPARIYPTPGWLNDGMGNHYRADADHALVRAKYIVTVRDYYSRHGSADETAAEVKAAEERGPGKFAAYQSVAVWLAKPPPARIVDLLKKRATAFAGQCKSKVAITGFRVVKETDVSKWRAV